MKNPMQKIPIQIARPIQSVKVDFAHISPYLLNSLEMLILRVMSEPALVGQNLLSIIEEHFGIYQIDMLLSQHLDILADQNIFTTRPNLQNLDVLKVGEWSFNTVELDRCLALRHIEGVAQRGYCELNFDALKEEYSTEIHKQNTAPADAFKLPFDPYGSEHPIDQLLEFINSNHQKMDNLDFLKFGGKIIEVINTHLIGTCWKTLRSEVQIDGQQLQMSASTAVEKQILDTLDSENFWDLFQFAVQPQKAFVSSVDLIVGHWKEVKQIQPKQSNLSKGIYIIPSTITPKQLGIPDGSIVILCHPNKPLVKLTKPNGGLEFNLQAHWNSQHILAQWDGSKLRCWSQGELSFQWEDDFRNLWTQWECENPTLAPEIMSFLGQLKHTLSNREDLLIGLYLYSFKQYIDGVSAFLCDQTLPKFQEFLAIIDKDLKAFMGQLPKPGTPSTISKDLIPCVRTYLQNQKDLDLQSWHDLGDYLHQYCADGMALLQESWQKSLQKPQSLAAFLFMRSKAPKYRPEWKFQSPQLLEEFAHIYTQIDFQTPATPEKELNYLKGLETRLFDSSEKNEDLRKLAKNWLDENQKIKYALIDWVNPNEAKVKQIFDSTSPKIIESKPTSKKDPIQNELHRTQSSGNSRRNPGKGKDQRRNQHQVKRPKNSK